MAGDFAAIGEVDEAVLAVDAQADGALGEELRAKSRGLSVRAPAQVPRR